MHKSQGSEFERVLMLMLAEVNPVLTRELFYTGISRAMSGVEVRPEASIKGGIV